MRVVDVNLFLYAYDASAPLHERAKNWLTRELNAIEPTGIARATTLAFLRIATASRILQEPFEMREACEIVDSWFGQPSVVLLEPSERHWRLFCNIAIASQARGALIAGADLAATAIEHGATLCTHDRDYSRFPGLRVEYPLMS
jgi:toxin-antitoxin system PIN domain toxin